MFPDDWHVDLLAGWLTEKQTNEQQQQKTSIQNDTSTLCTIVLRVITRWYSTALVQLYHKGCLVVVVGGEEGITHLKVDLDAKKLSHLFHLCRRIATRGIIMMFHEMLPDKN